MRFPSPRAGQVYTPLATAAQRQKSLKFSVCFLVTFWKVFGGILGVIFDEFSVLFSIKNVIDFSIDFPLIFGWILGAKMLENEHLAHTRRSFSQNRLFRFWHDFSYKIGPKMLRK